jgi:hypothetical protein
VIPDGIQFCDHDPGEEVPVEAVVAGTLCLMSCAMQTGSLVYVRKMVCNLNLLAGCPHVSDPMRRLCRNLACQWQGALDNATEPPGTKTCLPFSSRPPSKAMH